jgi:hypothetical protein
MHERAEIEAVVDALARLIGLVEGFAKGIEMRGWALPEVTTQMYAETAKAREALDRVRDARGDNEKQWTCDACEDTGIDRREGIPCGCDARGECLLHSRNLLAEFGAARADDPAAAES